MRVLITGAGGFIGSYLVEACISKGFEVRGLFLPGEDNFRASSRGVEMVVGDITKPETLVGICAGVDIGFHLAARVVDWGPVEAFHAVDVIGTQNLLREAKQNRIKRFI